MKQIFKGLGAALAVAATVVITPPASAETSTTHFNASVSSPSQSAGIYRFSTDRYAPEQIKRNVYASGGGVANDNYYYTTHYDVIGGLPVIEVTSYSLKNFGVEDSYTNRSMKNVATDIAYFGPRDVAYACMFNDEGTGYVFGKYRFGYWLVDKICDLDVALAAMDFDSKGTLYAIDWTGKLVIIDPKDGKQTEVGDTGLRTEMITGGAIERSTDTFYYSVYSPSESAIYKIDLKTANATKVYTLENNEQVGGLYFPQEYASGAPAASGNPTLNFTSGSLTGYVRFRAPQKSYGGDTVLDKVTYHIVANGKEVATGEAAYADGFMNADVTLDAPDMYCISLYFSNENGAGPRSKASQWIGPDTPKAPGSPRLTYKDGTVKVFWTASGSTGVNGGSINTSTMYYNVTRHPDMKLFEDVTTGFADQIEMPSERTTYKYEIKAIAGGIEGASAFTPEFALGPIVPPYSEKFATMYDNIGWKWINNDSYIEDNYSQTNGMRLVTMGMPDEGVFLSTPPVNLKKNSSYEIKFSARCGNSTAAEKFDLVAGKTCEASGLDIVLLEGEELVTTDLKEFTTSFVPEESGIYYIALKGTQSGKMIYLKEFNIGKGVSKGTPGAATEVVVTPDATGAHNATVSFKLPTLDSEGEQLETITKVELLRDGECVSVKSGELAPGAEEEMKDDSNPSVGNHTYSVVCYNDNGNGAAATAEAWIGFNEPMPVEYVKVLETETPGTVQISWSAATEDIDGKQLSDADVTYTLYNREGEQVRTGMTERELTLFVCDPQAEQSWTQYRVEAVSEGGTSELTKSILVPVGKPDAAPWNESWADKTATHLIGTTRNSVDDQWMVVGGFSYNDRDVDPQDNDGGMMGLENRLMDEPVALFTGKIDLSGLAEPAVSFWVYNYIGDNGLANANELEVMAFGSDDEEFKHIETIVISQTGPEKQWNRVVVPLSAYKDDTVRLRFEASVKTAIYMHFDNLSVDTHSACNVAARNMHAPASAIVDNEFEVSFDVANTGESSVGNVNAVLTRNGEQVATSSVGTLQPGATKQVVFKQCLSATDEDFNDYKCMVECEGDLVEADNATEVKTVALRRSGMPAPENLTAKNSEGCVLVEWTKPDTDNMPAAANTESFEKAQSWQSEVDGWTMIDYDRASIGGIGKKQLPVSGQLPFFVIDDTHSELNYANDGNRFKAHTGHKSLWSMYSMRGNYYVQSDDWAISPELYGGPQTISFWASSFEADADQPQYLETFEILVSEGGKEKEDFTLIDKVENVPARWTRYEFFLPAGSKHVAIRATSYDKYILMIDDVELRTATAEAEIAEVTGYKVWRNGKLHTTTPATALSYSDTDVKDGEKYEYRVSAMYGTEESAPTESASIDYDSSVDSVFGGSVSVYAKEGYLYIVGAEGQEVSVSRADGVMVYSGICNETLRISAASGIYLVRIGNTTTKLTVK